MEHTGSSEPSSDAAVESRREGEEKTVAGPESTASLGSENSGVVMRSQLHRTLSARQIQMMAVGGSIGTALFVSIGSGLIQGGPGSLLIAFVIYSCWLAMVNNCMAEMAIFMPVAGSFVRMGAKWVDEAFGFMLGWNFFLYEACLIPWEISALELVLGFWWDDVSLGAVCAICIVSYGILNVFAVKWYAESEYWLSIGKFLLVFIIFGFTFVTMVGGNPQHDAYGFRYWKKPGSFAEYLTTGPLGRFEGFLAALWKAAFTIVGPEYIAMMAGEAAHPRRTLKTAFKTVYWRFGFFFIGGALCCGIVLPYNDATLAAKLSSSSESGTGAASPYVIAMQNMGISFLPHLTNALLVTSIFSAGNSYVYCATRTLYSLSLDGHAPRFFQKCTKSGVPIWCFCATMVFPFISLLSLRESTSSVITWLANLTQASQMIDYICICIIYIFFHRALAAQNMSRASLPYTGHLQPYCAYAALGTMLLTILAYGYTVFLPSPGAWDVSGFFSYYAMVGACPVLWAAWKWGKGTRRVGSAAADLVWERPAIDAMEEAEGEGARCGMEERWRAVLGAGGVRKRRDKESL